MTKPKSLKGTKIYKGSISPNPERRGTRSQVRKMMAVKSVYNDFLQGATYSNVRDKLINDDYDLNFKYTDKSTQNIIHEAYDMIRDDFAKDREYLQAKLVATCNDVLGEAVKNNNGKLALEAVDRIAKLGGLYNQTQTQVNILGKGDMVIDFKLDDEGDTKQIENK